MQEKLGRQSKAMFLGLIRVTVRQCDSPPTGWIIQDGLPRVEFVEFRCKFNHLNCLIFK